MSRGLWTWSPLASCTSSGKRVLWLKLSGLVIHELVYEAMRQAPPG